MLCADIATCKVESQWDQAHDINTVVYGAKSLIPIDKTPYTHSQIVVAPTFPSVSASIVRTKLGRRGRLAMPVSMYERDVSRQGRHQEFSERGLLVEYAKEGTVCSGLLQL